MDVQSDALSTELSGLGGNSCQSFEIYVSKEENQSLSGDPALPSMSSEGPESPEAEEGVSS